MLDVGSTFSVLFVVLRVFRLGSDSNSRYQVHRRYACDSG